jgi:CRISPR/Cas system-associated exonuclease Cas4 (RecB family)
LRKRTIRASEIGTYLFCKRAWWYQNEGFESENKREMAGGFAYHRQHGKLVFKSIILRTAGWLLFVLALVLLVSWLTQLAFP